MPANTIIQIKKSGVTGNVPVSLSYGELALNYADGKVYYKNPSGALNFITSGITNSFATVNSNSSLILASSNTDTLSVTPGNDITISTDVINKKITIGTANVAYNLANAANTYANTAYWYAQAAFDAANTGGGGGSSPIFTNFTANTNLSLGQYYVLANTYNGPINITLPANPVQGIAILIGDGGGNKDANPAYILGNGKSINGVMDTLMFNSNGITFYMVYTNGGWRVLTNA